MILIIIIQNRYLKKNLNDQPRITPKLSFEIEIILDDSKHDLIGDFQSFIDAKKNIWTREC